MQEHVLSINDFSMPKVYDGSDADYLLIVRLLLLEPGTFQSHPNMGVGLKSKYRFNNDPALLQNLQTDIKNQINNYLPQLSTAEITVSLGEQHILGIIIDTGNGAYVLAYNGETDQIDIANNATYVLDDL